MASQPMYRNTFATLVATGLLVFSATGQAQESASENMIQTVEQAPYGAYLTDHEGMSLYMFDNDARDSQSTCVDVCANSWPPYTTAQPPEAGEGVDADKIGTIEREDGAQQVTYAGWPLYHFQGDKQPGDALGQNVEHLGAPWHLVSPDGERITQGERTGEPPMETAPSRGEEPASRGQEVHERTEDAKGEN